MRMSCFVLGLMATSIGVSQRAKAESFVTREYGGDDLGTYYSAPPYWTYQPKGFWSRKSAHWFYKNHRYVFIDIKLNWHRIAPLTTISSGTLGTTTVPSGQQHDKEHLPH